MGEDTYEFDSIFSSHPTSSRYYDRLIGTDKDGKRGLVNWIIDAIRDNLPSDWEGTIYKGLTSRDEITRKGDFPAIQVIPNRGEWEGVAICRNEETSTIYILTTTKDADPAYAYMKAQAYATDIYDLLRSTTPNDDFDAFENPPIDGYFDYDFEKGQNQFLGFSLLVVNYRWEISTEVV